MHVTEIILFVPSKEQEKTMAKLSSKLIFLLLKSMGFSAAEVNLK